MSWQQLGTVHVNLVRGEVVDLFAVFHCVVANPGEHLQLLFWRIRLRLAWMHLLREYIVDFGPFKFAVEHRN